MNKKATPQRLEFSGASLMNFHGLLTFLKPVNDIVKQTSYRSEQNRHETTSETDCEQCAQRLFMSPIVVYTQT